MPTPPTHFLLKSDDSFMADPDCGCLQCRIVRLEKESIPAITSQITQVVDNSITPIDSRLTQLEQEFVDFQERYNELLQRYNDTVQELKTTTSSLESLRASYNTLSGNYNTLNNNYNTLNNNYNTLNNNYNTLNKNYNTLNNNYNNLNSYYNTASKNYESVSRQAEFYLAVIHAIIQATYTLEIKSTGFGNELNATSAVRFIFPELKVTRPANVSSGEPITSPTKNSTNASSYTCPTNDYSPFSNIDTEPTTDMVSFYEWVQGVMNHIPLNVRPLWSLSGDGKTVGVHEMNFRGRCWFLTPVDYEDRITRKDSHYLNLGGITVRDSSVPNPTSSGTNWDYVPVFWGEGTIPQNTPYLYYMKGFSSILNVCDSYSRGFGTGYLYNDFYFGQMHSRVADPRLMTQVVK